jgi:hypothetical protein
MLIETGGRECAGSDPRSVVRSVEVEPGLAPDPPARGRIGSGRSSPARRATSRAPGASDEPLRASRGAILAGAATSLGPDRFGDRSAGDAAFDGGGIDSPASAMVAPPSVPGVGIARSAAASARPRPRDRFPVAGALRGDGWSPLPGWPPGVVAGTPAPASRGATWPTPIASRVHATCVPTPEMAARVRARGRGCGSPVEAVALRLWPVSPAGSEPARTELEERATAEGRREEESSGSPAVAEPARIGAGRLNPEWVERLMGFPDGWTDLAAPATGEPPLGEPVPRR